MKSFLLLFAMAISAFSAASADVGSSPRGRVLVVLSAASAIPLLEGGTHPTGIFLGELTEPAEAMLKAGYELSFASPAGRPATIDQESLDPLYWDLENANVRNGVKVYRELLAAGMQAPLPLESLAADEALLEKYDAIFVPGGHGPLVDLFYKDMFRGKALNAEMGKILEFFHRRARPTGLLCHAPAVLAAAPKQDGNWIYAGYKITAISRASEWFNEDFALTRVIQGHVGLYPSEILREAGADYDYVTFPFAPHVVEDRELMTGQDPFAARLMGSRFVEKLNSYMESLGR